MKKEAGDTDDNTNEVEHIVIEEATKHLGDYIFQSETTKFPSSMTFMLGCVVQCNEKVCEEFERQGQAWRTKVNQTEDDLNAGKLCQGCIDVFLSRHHHLHHWFLL